MIKRKIARLASTCFDSMRHFVKSRRASKRLCESRRETHLIYQGKNLLFFLTFFKGPACNASA